jgi:tight adherence protein B
MVIAAAVFVGMVSVIFGTYWVFVLRLEEHEERTLRRRLKVRRTTVTVVGPALVKARDRLSALAPLESILLRFRSTIEPLRLMLDRSGLQFTLGTVLLACVFLALVTLVVVTRFAGSALLGVGVAAAIASLPLLYVRRRANQRLAKFEEQFPDAIDFMARALRAGHALITTLQMTGDEIPDPVGGEFRVLFEQQNFGMSLTDALRAFGERMPLVDARFFVTAVLTQRETGGNLSEVLDNLAAVIRERFKVKRQVRVISAHGRITAWVLGLLPLAVAAVLVGLAPQQMRPLIDDPIGVRMLEGAVVLQLVGWFAIKRIVNVEY